MIITKELAQQIVNHIMPIVHQNVNIMNQQGVIIGSGHNHRIDTFHKGAMDVIDKGEAVEIYPDDLERYPGSLPGLNCPIVLGEHIVGVVGVSGDPDLVRDTARLVKMVTELILEREILVEEFRSQKHLVDQFFTLVLSEQTPDNHSKIRQRANLMNFNILLPRLTAVISIRPLLEDAYSNYGVSDFISSRTQKTIKQMVDDSPLVSADDLAALLDTRLIILKHFPAETNPELFRQWGLELLQLLQPENDESSMRIGLGSLVHSPFELHHSYQEASYALKNCLAGHNAGSIYDLDIMASYLISHSQSRSTCQAFKVLSEKITTKLDCKFDLANTVTQLLRNDLNMSSAAKSLYIHRNTLVFRLEKLKELTGLQPSQFLSHAIICKIFFSS